MKIQTAELIDCKDSLAEALLAETTYPWEALSKIGDYIRSLFPKLGDDFEEVAPEVYVHRDATVYPSAFIKGPAIIDAGTEVRHCAFIRGNALIGKDCVVGNSTEIKNSITIMSAIRFSAASAIWARARSRQTSKPIAKMSTS